MKWINFRRTVAQVCGVLTVTLSLANASDKPNVLLFLVDDMGLMDTSVPFVIGPDGEPEIQELNQFYRTPSMAKLAVKGVRFSQFYANSVCSPSRVSLLNGQSSARHHTTQWIDHQGKNSGPAAWNWEGIKPGDVTLPTLLKSAGYATIFCGKGHLGPAGYAGEDPTKLGFHVNIGGSSIGEPGSYYGQQNYGKGGIRPVPHLEKYHGSETFLTEALTLEVNKAVSKAKASKKPFFVEMSQYALHTPFQSDPRFTENYTQSGKSANAQAFATLVEGMDKSLGDMIQHLEKIGEAENTLVIFVGDNGSDAPLGGKYAVSSSAPLRGQKGTHYEGGMRVPFIVSWAKPNPQSAMQQKFPVKPGVVTQDFGTIIDILPTILKLTGVSAPEGHVIDGQDLSCYLGTHKGEHDQTFLMHFPHDHRSSHYTVLRDADWKIIYHYKKPEADRVELFNLVKDPSESTNLAASEPQKVAEMVAKMQAKLDLAGAQYATDAAGNELRPQL